MRAPSAACYEGRSWSRTDPNLSTRRCNRCADAASANIRPATCRLPSANSAAVCQANRPAYSASCKPNKKPAQGAKPGRKKKEPAASIPRALPAPLLGSSHPQRSQLGKPPVFPACCRPAHRPRHRSSAPVDSAVGLARRHRKAAVGREWHRRQQHCGKRPRNHCCSGVSSRSRCTGIHPATLTACMGLALFQANIETAFLEATTCLLQVAIWRNEHPI